MDTFRSGFLNDSFGAVSEETPFSHATCRLTPWRPTGIQDNRGGHQLTCVCVRLMHVRFRRLHSTPCTPRPTHDRGAVATCTPSASTRHMLQGQQEVVLGSTPHLACLSVRARPTHRASCRYEVSIPSGRPRLASSPMAGRSPDQRRLNTAISALCQYHERTCIVACAGWQKPGDSLGHSSNKTAAVDAPSERVCRRPRRDPEPCGILQQHHLWQFFCRSSPGRTTLRATSFMGRLALVEKVWSLREKVAETGDQEQ